MHVCNESIDGVTLYLEENEVEVGSWIATDPIQGAAQWQLDATPDWDDSGEAVALIEGERYAMYGWTENNSASADHVTFTLADLQDLRPGQVWWGEPAEVTTLSEFANQVCAAR